MNFIHRKPKIFERLFAMLTIFTMVFSTGGFNLAYAGPNQGEGPNQGGGPNQGEGPNPSNDEVTICHWDEDHGGEFSKQTVGVNDNGLERGYQGHNNDIVPPTTTTGKTHSFQKNWNTQNQAIWEHDCFSGGKVTVDKVVTGTAYKNKNDNKKGGKKEVTDKDFELKVGDKKVTDNDKEKIEIGTYTVTEKPGKDVPTNYTTTFSGDCDADGQITIGIGDDKKCTITNDYTPLPTTGTIIVQKQFADGTTPVDEEQFSFLVNGNGATAFEADGENELEDQTPGHFTITETTATNYTPTYTNCDFDLTAGETETCVIKNEYTPETMTGTLRITKYECPADTLVMRSVNGVGGTVPETCTLDEGAYFGYVHGEKTDANGPYPELDETPVPAGATDSNGILEVTSLPSDGRYLIVETDVSNVKLAHNAILGLYCEGDGDTNDANNDNQELTFVQNGETTNCVAYNIKTAEPDYCTVTLVSGLDDNNDKIDDATTVTEKGGAFAKLLTTINDRWSALISGAKWIWGDDPVAAPVDEVTQNFVQKFGWNGPVTSAKLTIAADNTFDATLNGNPVGSDLTEFNYQTPAKVYDVQGLIAQGNNEFGVEVYNMLLNSDLGNPATNPAGLLYKLEIKGTDEGCEIPYVEEPKVCVISSDATTLVDGEASTLTWVHDNWTTELASGDAEWIWDDTQEPHDGEILTFTKTFNVDSVPTSATLKVAADNSYTATLNGNPLTCDGSGSTNFASVDTCTAPVVSGVNTLTFVATNDPYGTYNAHTNPGGLIYELTIDGSSCSTVPTEPDTYQISGYKWNDIDSDGQRNEGEQGIGDWGIVVKPMTLTPFDTVFVPATSAATIPSNLALTAGRTYLVEVSGTYKFANWSPYGIADAEWSYRSASYTPDNIAGWVKGEGYFASECGLDLQMNGCYDWGALNETNTHLYKAVVQGDGTPLEFSIYDNQYSDNEGGLNVEIYDVTDYITHTESDGMYTVHVPAGDYQIVEIMQEGWEQTYPNNPSYYHVTVPSEGENYYNFGNKNVNQPDPQTKCLVDGYVYDEADNSPLGGWTVGLDLSGNDGTVGKAETNSDGYYCIEETADKETADEDMPQEIYTMLKSFFVTTAHAMVTNTHVVYQTLLPGWSDSKVEVDGIETPHVSGGTYGDTSVDVTLPLDRTLRVDFYNTKDTTVSNGSGRILSSSSRPSGETHGVTIDKRIDTIDDTQNGRPDGEVEGAQTSIMPSNSPDAGAGGTSNTPSPMIPAMAFFGIIASFVLLRITPVNEM